MTETKEVKDLRVIPGEGYTKSEIRNYLAKILDEEVEIYVLELVDYSGCIGGTAFGIKTYVPRFNCFDLPLYNDNELKEKEIADKLRAEGWMVEYSRLATKWHTLIPAARYEEPVEDEEDKWITKYEIPEPGSDRAACYTRMLDNLTWRWSKKEPWGVKVRHSTS